MHAEVENVIFSFVFILRNMRNRNKSEKKNIKPLTAFHHSHEVRASHQNHIGFDCLITDGFCVWNSSHIPKMLRLSPFIDHHNNNNNGDFMKSIAMRCRAFTGFWLALAGYTHRDQKDRYKLCWPNVKKKHT